MTPRVGSLSLDALKAKPSKANPEPHGEKTLRVRVRALEIPPVKDGLVIGRNAAIGGEAMARTLRLMSNEKFERVIVKDPVVHEILVRSAVMRKVGQDRLLKFVLERIKPIMSESELLLLEIEVELLLEASI